MWGVWCVVCGERCDLRHHSASCLARYPPGDAHRAVSQTECEHGVPALYVHKRWRSCRAILLDMEEHASLVQEMGRALDPIVDTPVSASPSSARCQACIRREDIALWSRRGDFENTLFLRLEEGPHPRVWSKTSPIMMQMPPRGKPSEPRSGLGAVIGYGGF